MNDLLLWLITPAGCPCPLVNGTLCFIRVALGLCMMRHGLTKLKNGPETWRYLGEAMGNFGIHWMPVMWGLLATCTELFGGAFFVLGLGTRVASFFLAFVMLVAVTMHIKNNDTFTTYSHALSLLIIFASFTVIGGGVYSLDTYLYKQHTEKIAPRA